VCVTIDREVAWRFVLLEPARHGRRWRNGDAQRFQRHAVDRLEQQLDDVVGFARAG
jgi:hypothetical protein